MTRVAEMRISGILPLRNGTKLGYPYHLAIFSMRALCDEIVVLVDPTSEDNTLDMVKKISNVPWCTGNPETTEMGRFVIVESQWDMNNHYGHTNCEISVQTAKACEAATGDWIFSLQADEILHENEVGPLRKVVEIANEKGITGIELERLYFYGSLGKIRQDWTQWLLRLFKRGCYKPDVDGAMKMDPIGPQIRMRTDCAKIYHYSRIGDPALIANRVRNLDRFFHAPEKVQSGDLQPYDFVPRKLDSYVIGHESEMVDGNIVDFEINKHPKLVTTYYK